MCTTCGCGTATSGHGAHTHHHDHPHGHDHQPHGPAPAGDAAEQRRIAVEQALFAKNDRLAAENRRRLAGPGVVAFNLVSSPGSGKTSLLVRTLSDLAASRRMAVIEGDQATDLDAKRIAATGVPAIQVNTGPGCHLDAAMVAGALKHIDVGFLDILFVENVGNLVCPAAFDLGETAKVVVVSVTEGDDKPLKYPDMFAASRLMLVTKTDLLPHVPVSLERLVENARRVNPAIETLAVSAQTGLGLSDWYDWLDAQCREAAEEPPDEAAQRLAHA